MCKQGTEKEIRRTDGQVRSCDECIQPLVQAFNDNGAQTVASCCGHGKMPGSIILADGREVHILRDWQEGRMVDALFPALHPRRGEWKHRLRRSLARAVLTRGNWFTNTPDSI